MADQGLPQSFKTMKPKSPVTGFFASLFLLIAALTLPLAAAGQKEWLTSLSPTARLFLSSGVVIAITLGIVLNASLRAALGPRSEPL